MNLIYFQIFDDNDEIDDYDDNNDEDDDHNLTGGGSDECPRGVSESDFAWNNRDDFDDDDDDIYDDHHDDHDEAKLSSVCNQTFLKRWKYLPASYSDI